ncbi:MAG: BBP7 family outer membrane beta-barrel protein [Gemmataceae bacterium]|nr:BBP7 family outer membrane beta-barrel protein [Gemmataceae bacterium]MCI0737689.1 BBP7 family outer membrane beta-barrel protein [Gemmataceae bacterium]
MNAGRLLSGIVLALGLGVAVSSAQDPAWRPVNGSTRPAVSLGAPLVAPAAAGPRVVRAKVHEEGAASATRAQGTVQVAADQSPPSLEGDESGQTHPSGSGYLVTKHVSPFSLRNGAARILPSRTLPRMYPDYTSTVSGLRMMQRSTVLPTMPALITPAAGAKGKVTTANALYVPSVQETSVRIAQSPKTPAIIVEEVPTNNEMIYGSIEYLHWWFRGQNLPPLVATAPATVPEDVRGTLGDPNTTILFGNERVDEEPHSGLRIRGGFWLDCCSCWAIEGGYFILGERNDGFFDARDVLTRPIFNVNFGVQDRQFVSTPGILATDNFILRGNVSVDTSSELQGGDLAVRCLLLENCRRSWSALAGIRFLQLDEGLSITENVVSFQAIQDLPVFDPGNLIVVNDIFDTRNRFYGGFLGVNGSMRRGDWYFEGLFKLGIGVTDHRIRIRGSQNVLTPAGALSQFNGGLLATTTNIGDHSDSSFSVVPELGLKVGYHLTKNIRVFAGYDLLYWTNVMRPGDQVDLNVNVTNVPNFCPPGTCPPSDLAVPAVPFRRSDFWATGFSAGLELRY